MKRAIDRPGHALAWMALSALGFTVMAAAIKTLGQAVPQFELVFFRSIINLIVVAGVMLWTRERLPSSGRGLLLFRGVVGFLGVTCLFYTVTHLPLPVALLLSWCSPAFVLLFSFIFLKERMPTSRLIWVGVALAGLPLLLGLDPRDLSLHVPLLAAGVGLFGAACSGLAYVAVRAATAKVGVNTIILYFVATSTVLSAPLAVATFRAPTVREWGLLVAAGLCASLGQYAMTQAYRYAPAGVVSTMGLLNPMYGVALGATLFNEWLSPAQWLGFAIVMTAIGGLSSSRS
jgi:drug/metabolite transporter (DMT)-like permease